jgi:surface antigen
MIEVELPDGRVLQIETTDPAAAAEAGRRFMASQQGPPTAEQAAERQVNQGARPLTEAAALGRGVADGATFGFADELTAGMAAINPVSAVMDWATGTGRGMSDRYNESLAQQRGAITADENNRSGARLAGQIGGAVATGVGAVGAGATATRLAAPTAGALPRAGLAAVDGAVMGGLAGAGQGTSPEGRASGAAMGALLGAPGGAAGSLIGTGVGRMIGARAPTAPTADQLRSGANAAYEAADSAGVIIAPQRTQQLVNNVIDDLTEFGYHPGLHSRMTAVLSELDRVSQEPITLKGMEIVRRIARNAAQSQDASEATLGSRVIERIDEAISGLGPEDVMGGNVRQGVDALQQARSLWSSMRKDETVSDALSRAELRAASTGSGGNLDNATRQNIRAILENPRASRGFTADERAALETVVRGTPTQNALRLVGKLSPEGSGLMAALGLGATAANPWLAIPPIAGFVAKRASDGLTNNNVRVAQALIRSGGDRAATQAPMTQRELIARALMERLGMATAATSVAQDR